MKKMSYWPEDISKMHTKFGVNPIVRNMPPDKLKSYLKFRLDMVQEEINEAMQAFEQKNADGVVDALIDTIVFALGTLDVFDVDAQLAWQRVYEANMAKEPGIKQSRPNPFGFPDFIKPDGWVAPSHHDNIGLLDKALKN